QGTVDRADGFGRVADGAERAGVGEKRLCFPAAHVVVMVAVAAVEEAGEGAKIRAGDLAAGSGDTEDGHLVARGQMRGDLQGEYRVDPGIACRRRKSDVVSSELFF